MRKGNLLALETATSLLIELKDLLEGVQREWELHDGDIALCRGAVFTINEALEGGVTKGIMEEALGLLNDLLEVLQEHGGTEEGVRGLASARMLLTL